MIITNFLLYVGIILSQSNDHIGSEKILSQLNPPPELKNQYHYYRLVNNFRLNKKHSCEKEIEILENICVNLPTRYKVTIPLIKTELALWKDDKKDLEDISREMKKVRDMLKHARAGQVTIDAQKDIVKRLDSIIKQKEDQLKKQKEASMAKSQPNPSNPIQPADDSHIDNTGGKGTVQQARIRKLTGQWGQMERKDREKSLQELIRDMPPRYRDSIQNYFRNLPQIQGVK